MAELLRGKGVVVCLHASVETILERTGRQSDRPLLDVADPVSRVRELLAEREPIYRSVGSLILTDARPLRDIVSHVIRVWHRESEEFLRRAAS